MDWSPQWCLWFIYLPFRGAHIGNLQVVLFLLMRTKREFLYLLQSHCARQTEKTMKVRNKKTKEQRHLVMTELLFFLSLIIFSQISKMICEADRVSACMCTALDPLPKLYFQITGSAQLYISAIYFRTQGKITFLLNYIFIVGRFKLTEKQNQGHSQNFWNTCYPAHKECRLFFNFIYSINC